MTKPLENKIALVTGAARGIGQAIALQLAADGADLALCDVKAEWLEDTIAKVKALGRRAEGYAMDVANGAAVGEAVAKILADFGRIDVLVNNAGITRDTLLMRMSEEDWDAVLDINLKGAFLVTKAVVKPMMKQRSGAIVNIASVVGIMGNPGQANYTASKAGLIALTKTTAKELGSRNIRVNAVAPGFIRTAMTDKLAEPVKEAMLKMVPLGRLGEPEDVAKAVAFLASDAAAYVNGQTLAVCGGMVW
ncbi:MAG TPA: 3-oxoacyl-[acyl-carrier-protein] reductase [Kiritimatiellia bacterium]|nr:3-oxoacyl-[acyl-carrier-protein] reductase [Kiritimatiellia bacterium]